MSGAPVRRSASTSSAPPGKITRVTDADLAQRYARTVQAVEAVLARADIEGLIADGAPANEYSPEAPELARLILRDNLNEQTLEDFWLTRFGPSCLLPSGKLLVDLLAATAFDP